jgi:RNA polymerase sigma-70 factor (ECF subfamily)
MVEEKHAAFYLQMYQDGTDYEELDERIRTMYRMLDDLAPKTRLILQECYLHKKSYKEVAEELGVTTDAVKKHIVKALKTLRGKISKIDPEEST